MSLKSNILKLDIYARRVGLFYKNKEKIGSYCGLFLTFLYVIISIILFAYYLALTIKRNEIRVYDSSLYSQKMPTIDLQRNYFYFAFGLEDPVTLNRFIDETIYHPEVVYVDRAKINGEFVTINKFNLELDRCKEGAFGHNYNHLFVSHELDNSYCLKDFDYNLTLQGGFKYEKMSYIRIKIFPCKNTTENNNHCKPKEKLEQYMTSGYFSILLKDIGLNPSNYSHPVIPTLQDLYTTIDRRLYKNYILQFGLTEIHTDIGLVNEQINKEKFIQFRKEYENFVFNEDEYNTDREIILVQIRLEDNIVVQKRAYTKISEIFSRIGGYMQLMNTIFLLLSLLINKLDAELTILNSIFNYNLKENSISLKYQTLNSLYNSQNHKFLRSLSLSFKKNLTKEFNNKESDNNKSNSYLILNNNINKNKEIILNNNKRNIDFIENNKNDQSFHKINLNKNEENAIRIHKDNTKNSGNIPKGYIGKLNLNFIDRIFKYKHSKKNKMLNLFYLARSFYRKRMDIVLAFSQSILAEKFFLKGKENFNKTNFFCKEIELTYQSI